MSKVKLPRRALITGASGYIGSNLVRHLLADNWEVHIVVRPASDLKLVNSELTRIKLHYHDGTSVGMVEVMKDANPDTVFHLASLFLAQHHTEEVDSLISSNVLFSVQLVEAMVVNGVGKLVNTATSWQHYLGGEYNPVNLYAATKQAFEDILSFYVESYGIRVATLVLYDTYGCGDPRKKIIPLLLSFSSNKELLEMSPGEQLLDIVHVDDVVRAYSLAADSLVLQQDLHVRYRVSSGSPIRLVDLVTEFQKITNSSLNVEFGRRPYRFREVMVPWDKYDLVPGWAPTVSLKDGLMRLIK